MPAGNLPLFNRRPNIRAPLPTERDFSARPQSPESNTINQIGNVVSTVLGERVKRLRQQEQVEGISKAMNDLGITSGVNLPNTLTPETALALGKMKGNADTRREIANLTAASRGAGGKSTREAAIIETTMDSYDRQLESVSREMAKISGTDLLLPGGRARFEKLSALQLDLVKKRAALEKAALGKIGVSLPREAPAPAGGGIDPARLEMLRQLLNINPR